jgi:hypothetical protein
LEEIVRAYFFLEHLEAFASKAIRTRGWIVGSFLIRDQFLKIIDDALDYISSYIILGLFIINT